LLPETDRNGALLVAERYRGGLQRFFASREVAGNSVSLTVSGGVASYPDDATTGERLLELAAQALYQAKASGRNAVHPYRPERRRYLRFELEPGLFEIEVLAPPQHPATAMRNLSRNGILFVSPERLEIGEPIEIRLAQEHGSTAASVRLRGTVVRLEELPLPVEAEADEELPVADRYEIGVALDLDWGASDENLLGFLERVQTRRLGHHG